MGNCKDIISIDASSNPLSETALFVVEIHRPSHMVIPFPFKYGDCVTGAPLLLRIVYALEEAEEARVSF